jgi:MFS family permease
MLQKLRHSLRLFITGGDWANRLPHDERRNLYWYWFDGLFSAASDTIPINYLTLYLLTLGASGAQVGWFSSLSSLAAAACLLPGALLVEKWGRRKDFTVFFGGVLARLMLLALALAPFPASGQWLVWLVISLGILRSALGNLAFPAWMSITGDIVPLEGRGRYFGSRNVVMIIAGIVMTYLVGELITRTGSWQGYQLAFGLSFVTGLVSTWFFFLIKDPAGEEPVQSALSLSFAAIWQNLRASPVFLQFCLASALWNFAVNVAGPFFNVHMAQDMHFSASMIGVTIITTSVTKLLTQRKLGELADRWGAGRVQLVSMFLIPSLPLAWLFVSRLWHVVLINIFGGVFWGAFELASFNFLLVFMPEGQRARYSAIFQLVVTLALAGGAALGSALIDSAWGYSGVFLTSASGRILAALLFLRLLGRSPAAEVSATIKGN